MLPPVSVPRPPRNIPAAIPLAVPELEPPAHVVRSQGLRGTGKGFSASGYPTASSIVVVLPTMIPPPARNRETTGASLIDELHPWSSARLCPLVGPSAVR